MKRTWRCTDCGARLGEVVDGRLTLKYKEAAYKITGRGFAVSTNCRKCGAENRKTHE